MRCPSCDRDNRADRRFCAECGAALAVVCASCGAPNQPGEKFCGRLRHTAPRRGARDRRIG
jgi:predicted amidophosphoribosyltransferase